MLWIWEPNDAGAGHVADKAELITLPPVHSDEPFTALVASWNIDLPENNAAIPAARVHVRGEWSRWYALAHWGSGTDPDTGELLPRSLPDIEHEPGPATVDIDTLRLRESLQADAFQLRITIPRRILGAVRVHRMAATTFVEDQASELSGVARRIAPLRLEVPCISQMHASDEIASMVCSPTCLTMVLAYYGVERSIAEVISGVEDHYGPITYGNWSFNTAYAGAQGLRAVVRHFRDLSEVESELRSGRPVILATAWREGELPEAPLPSSNGHLIVATGVDERGDFWVNDPRADPRLGQDIARLYTRDHLANAFSGIGYAIEPPISRLPEGKLPWHRRSLNGPQE